MHSVFFWKSWIPSYRTLFYTVAGIFLFALLFLWFGYFHGADGVIQWEKFQEQKIVETIVHEFRLGPFVIDVPGDSYAILEYFNGSHIAPNQASAYIFLVVLSVAAVILLAVITTLPRFWYLIGMGLFIVFLVSLRFEVLALAGYTNRIPVAIVLLFYLLPAFYFKQIRSSVSFVNRIYTFGILTITERFEDWRIRVVNTEPRR